MLAKSLFLSLALAAASVHASLYISTPNELKQCEETTFVISGATGSVWPFVVNPNAPCDDPYRELDDLTGDLKWKPDLPVGTSVMLAIEDEAGNEAWSGALTIAPGSDSSCVSNNPSSPTSPTSPISPPYETPAATTSTTTSSSYKNPGVTVLGGPDTPQNAVSPANNGTQPSGAVPARALAASGVTVLTVLSAVALAL